MCISTILFLGHGMDEPLFIRKDISAVVPTIHCEDNASEKDRCCTLTVACVYLVFSVGGGVHGSGLGL